MFLKQQGPKSSLLAVDPRLPAEALRNVPLGRRFCSWEFPLLLRRNRGRFFSILPKGSFKAAAVDPYIAMRESYILYRDKQIRE